MQLSIVIPCLNEAGHIRSTLESLQSARRRGAELVLVDGGSHDDTLAHAVGRVDRVLETSPGRAAQMNFGAARCTGDLLWFVHADTRVPDEADLCLQRAVRSGARWGRFDVRLSGKAPALRLVEGLMNRRSSLTGIATGDQGIFVCRDAFEAVGGFPQQPLMEDVEISARLKRAQGRPACLRPRLVTSSRRWEQDGIWSTIGLMWALRLAYFAGVDPVRLEAWYRRR